MQRTGLVVVEEPSARHGDTARAQAPIVRRVFRVTLAPRLCKTASSGKARIRAMSSLSMALAI